MQSDGEQTIVALKTATLLTAPLVDLVLRESPVGDHATNVKRQTRTLKFVLEAHVGKVVVVSHSILRWTPMVASDVISFFRIGTDGLTAEM